MKVSTIFYFLLIVFFSDWADKDEDAGDVNVWEDNWDDDNVEDDFSRQLRYYQFQHSLLSLSIY